jgi:hypothetical protein
MCWQVTESAAAGICWLWDGPGTGAEAEFTVMRPTRKAAAMIRTTTVVSRRREVRANGARTGALIDGEVMAMSFHIL